MNDGGEVLLALDRQRYIMRKVPGGMEGSYVVALNRQMTDGPHGTNRSTEQRGWRYCAAGRRTWG